MKKNIFRTLFVSTLLASATFFAACDEDLGIPFNVPYEMVSIYKIDPVTGTVISRTDTLNINLDSLLAENNAEREDITAITTSAANLAITDSLGNVIPTSNFTSVKSIMVEIENIGNGTTLVLTYDSVAMASFGTNNPIVSSATDAQFGVNLLEYFLDDTFTIKNNIVLYSPLLTPIYIKTKITANISAVI